MEQITKLLERIAVSLEKIASDQIQIVTDIKTPRRITSQPVKFYLQAIDRNSDKLNGRMSLQEIAEAIGVEVTRSDQASIGTALTEWGALKGKSGSTRYYIFD